MTAADPDRTVVRAGSDDPRRSSGSAVSAGPDDRSAGSGSAVAALSAELVARLTAAGRTVATAESLTGGLVAARLTDVPGSSEVVRGGVVSYAIDVKAEVLGVDPDLLAARGAVDGEVAAQMATGVRELLHATYGLATTGVAGPGPAGGKPAGTVYVAVAGPDGDPRVRRLSLDGDRAVVREQTVEAVLGLLAESL